MKVTVIPVVIGALGTIPKVSIKELEGLEIRGQAETIQTTVLLRSARILRSVQGTCCHSISSEKSSANAGVEISYKSKIIILSNKLERSHMRRLGYGYRKGNLKRETESLPIAAQTMP